MQVLAALGDAPTAAIAVAAILLGVLLAARGPREQRAAGGTADASEPTPTLLNVPISPAPEAEPGFVGPEGSIVGHGPIRLGAVGPLSGVEPAAAPPPPPPPPEPAPPEPVAPPAPPAIAAEPPMFEPPPAVPPFRQGTIRLGGRSAGRPED